MTKLSNSIDSFSVKRVNFQEFCQNFLKIAFSQVFQYFPWNSSRLCPRFSRFLVYIVYTKTSIFSWTYVYIWSAISSRKYAKYFRVFTIFSSFLVVKSGKNAVFSIPSVNTYRSTVEDHWNSRRSPLDLFILIHRDTLDFWISYFFFLYLSFTVLSIPFLYILRPAPFYPSPPLFLFSSYSICLSLLPSVHLPWWLFRIAYFLVVQFFRKICAFCKYTFSQNYSFFSILFCNCNFPFFSPEILVFLDLS